MLDRSILAVDEAKALLSEDAILRDILTKIAMANILPNSEDRRNDMIAHFVTEARYLSHEDKQKLLAIYTELQTSSLLNESIHLAIISSIQNIPLLHDFMQSTLFNSIAEGKDIYKLLALPIFITHGIYKQRPELEGIWQTLLCYVAISAEVNEIAVDELSQTPWAGNAYRICEKYNYLDIDKKELMAVRLETLRILQINQALANAITTVNDFHEECERLGLHLSDNNKKKDFKSLLHSVYEENGVAPTVNWCRCFHKHRTLLEIVKQLQQKYDINPALHLG